MKKSFFLFIGVIAVFLLLFTGCAGFPFRIPPETVEEPPQADLDIWSLLRQGDDRARGYFLGEIDVNAVDSMGKTPLHYAAERRDPHLTSFFIALGANTNALDHSGQSPLGISVENNDPETARLISAGGADIHLPIKNNTTAVALALGMNNSIFNALLTQSSIQTTDNSGKTVLHLASIAGSVQAVRSIINTNSSTNFLNRTDNTQKNALDYALERSDSRNHIEIAEQLILPGAFTENPIFHFLAPAVRSANYNIRRNGGIAPIHFAVINDSIGLISFLLEKEIDINIKSTSGATALHEAVRKGNIEVIRLLLDNGAEVNSMDANGNTPLHIGVPSEVHREVITLLMQRNADPNLRDEHGETPLHIAIILNRRVDVIQALLNGKGDVHIRNIEGKTPLYIAVQEGRTSLIPVLLSYGSEIFAADNRGTTPFDIASRLNNNTLNLLITPDTVNQRDSEGNTILHVSVRNRVSPQQIGRILDSRAPVEARNRDGDTALHYSVRLNQREAGELLISRGANIFSLNSAGDSPLLLALSSNPVREWIINPTTIIARDGLGNNMLHYAAQWGLTNVIPLIIRNGIPVDETNATGQTPLFMAMRSDSPPTIRVLIENNANLNTRDSQGNSVLHAAVRWNAINSASFLISNGVDINAHSLNGNTPLHEAVILETTDIETLLIRQGANLESRNIDGNTPFMEAVRASKIPSVDNLRFFGADPSTRNTRGDTPLHTAVSMEDFDLVNAILRMGVSIHARNTSNRTPFHISLSISPRMVSALLGSGRIHIPDDMGNSALHIALNERASTEIIRTIIAQGSRLDIVDSNGKTPLRIAVDLESWASAKILADTGADPFLTAVDNRTPAEIAFTKGEDCIRAIFSGRAVNSRDSSGNTILHIAARLGTPQSIALLFELGANRTIRNIAVESPYDIAMRWNRIDNAEMLRF